MEAKRSGAAVVGGTREIMASHAVEEREPATHATRRDSGSAWPQRHRLWSRRPTAVAGPSRQTREVVARQTGRPGGPRPTEREERQRWGRVRAGGGRWARGARRRTTRSSGPRARVARPAAADATVRCSNPQRDSRLMITLVPYDPAWPIMFEVEANQIRGVFRDLALRVEHVGSTAVPGLSAKPVIDIQASVACLTPFEPYLRLLASVAYPHVPLGEFDRVYLLLQIWDSGVNAR
jgi:GrpB protein